MMEQLRSRGEAIAKRRLVRARSKMAAALAEDLPDDVRIGKSADGIRIEGRRLMQRLMENSSLRDIAFLTRAVL